MKMRLRIASTTISILLFTGVLLIATFPSGSMAKQVQANAINFQYSDYLPLIAGYDPNPPPATATSMSTPAATATNTSTATATNTSTATATNTSTATATDTPTATITSTATVTSTATATVETTETPTATATATATPGPVGEEIVVYQLNRPVTKAFTVDNPPDENGDWTLPPNYARGFLYMRAEIRSQPVPQSRMTLLFCFWQNDLQGNPWGLETCSSNPYVSGESGTIVTWSNELAKMYKADGNPLDWTRTRRENGLVVKKNNIPVSGAFDWAGGEDPKDWYPLDLCFLVVAVGEGNSFSGWENYTNLCELEAEPTNTPTPTNTPEV